MSASEIRVTLTRTENPGINSTRQMSHHPHHPPTGSNVTFYKENTNDILPARSLIVNQKWKSKWKTGNPIENQKIEYPDENQK